jgi:hypothetical protein
MEIWRVWGPTRVDSAQVAGQDAYKLFRVAITWTRHVVSATLYALWVPVGDYPTPTNYSAID